MNLLASGSIPAEGSSSKIMDGLPIVAIATASFLLLPPLKVPAGFEAWSDKFKSIIALSTTSFYLIDGIPFSLA